MFRGIVTDTADPQHAHRVRLQIPDALGDDISDWALAVHPHGGGYAPAPPKGTAVWVMFEGGHVDFPVVTGLIIPLPAGRSVGLKWNTLSHL